MRPTLRFADDTTWDLLTIQVTDSNVMQAAANQNALCGELVTGAEANGGTTTDPAAADVSAMTDTGPSTRDPTTPEAVSATAADPTPVTDASTTGTDPGMATTSAGTSTADTSTTTSGSGPSETVPTTTTAESTPPVTDTNTGAPPPQTIEALVVDLPLDADASASGVCREELMAWCGGVDDVLGPPRNVRLSAARVPGDGADRVNG